MFRKISRFIVFLCVFFIFFGIKLNASYAKSPSLIFDPAKIDAQKYQEFDVIIYIDTDSESISVVTADLVYSTSDLQVISIDSSASVFQSVAVEDYSQEGVVSISRFMNAGDGFIGRGIVAKVKFKVIGEKNSEINFSDDAGLISSDAVNVLKNTNSFKVMTEKPESATTIIPSENSIPVILIAFLVVISLLFLCIMMIKILKSRKKSLVSNDENKQI